METSRLAPSLFVGYRLTSTLALALKKSRSWQKAQIVGDQPIQELINEGETYIGLLIPKAPTLQELRGAATTLRSTIERHCPDIEVGPLKISIFPQLLIA